MGITQISLDRIGKYLKPNVKILILGCQNLYDNEHYGQIAHQYFEECGYQVRSWDITGCQGSETVDLRDKLNDPERFDLILQHGTVEHIDGGLYQPFKNIHDLCPVDGVIIHENPMKNNWPGHGYHYFTKDFYRELANLNGVQYFIEELTEEAAMGNTVDGCNVSCVLRKLNNMFCTEEQFNKIYADHIFSK